MDFKLKKILHYKNIHFNTFPDKNIKGKVSKMFLIKIYQNAEETFKPENI